MAFFPVSIFFELILMALGLWFIEEGLIRRIIGTGMFATVLTLFLQKQVFIIENAGVLSISEIGYPTSIVRPIAPFLIFIIFVGTLKIMQQRMVKEED